MAWAHLQLAVPVRATLPPLGLVEALRCQEISLPFRRFQGQQRVRVHTSQAHFQRSQVHRVAAPHQQWLCSHVLAVLCQSGLTVCPKPRSNSSVLQQPSWQILFLPRQTSFSILRSRAFSFEGQ